MPCSYAALLTLTPKSDKEVMRMTEANHRGYAERHGYTLHTIPPVDDGGKRHPVWSKLHAVLSISHLYDWIWMIDDDALIMNAALPLTDFIEEKYSLIVSMLCVLGVPMYWWAGEPAVHAKGFAIGRLRHWMLIAGRA